MHEQRASDPLAPPPIARQLGEGLADAVADELHDDALLVSEHLPAGHAAVRLSGIASILLLEVGLPVAAYYGWRAAGLPQFTAMLLATGVAGTRLVWNLARHRRVDPFNALMMVLFAGSLAVSFISGDPRYMLLRGVVVSGGAGLLFLGSLLMRYPMTFVVVRRILAARGRQQELTRAWEESAEVRRAFVVTTAVLGCGMALDSLLRALIVMRLDLDVAGVRRRSRGV